jgi:hypothetical protein
LLNKTQVLIFFSRFTIRIQKLGFNYGILSTYIQFFLGSKLPKLPLVLRLNLLNKTFLAGICMKGTLRMPNFKIMSRYMQFCKFFPWPQITKKSTVKFFLWRYSLNETSIYPFSFLIIIQNFKILSTRYIKMTQKTSGFLAMT